MDKKEKVVNTIFAALDAVNETLPKDRQITKTMDTILIGDSSAVDSLSITMLIVAVEDGIRREFGFNIQLTSILTISYDNKIIKDVSYFADYIMSAMEKKNG